MDVAVGEKASLEMMISHNEIDCLVDLSQYEEADSRLSVVRSMYESNSAVWVQHRYLWVQGRITRGLGDLVTARRSLSLAREGFIKASLPYETALVSLELALVYLEAGLEPEVQVLAASTVEVFRALGIRREAFAAMRLFYIATLRDQATEELAQRLLRYYAQARFSPGLALRDVR
jgi:hypothetical protein